MRSSTAVRSGMGISIRNNAEVVKGLREELGRFAADSLSCQRASEWAGLRIGEESLRMPSSSTQSGIGSRMGDDRNNRTERSSKS